MKIVSDLAAEAGRTGRAGLPAVLIDTDMGLGTPASDVDDAFAVALMLGAARLGQLRVLGVSATYGNVPLSEALPNLIALLDILSASDVPVASGARGPYLQDISEWRRVQGRARGPASPSYRPAARGCRDIPGAIEWMSSTILSADRPVEVLTLGPLTTLATVLTTTPEVRERIERVTVMGGAAFTTGNVTASAELNVWMDPEAAAVVFRAGIPLVMVGLDVTRRRQVKAEDFEAWGPESAGPALRYLRAGALHWIACRTKLFDEPWFYVHDAVAAAYLVRPDLFRAVPAHVDVELSGAYTRGATVVDTRRWSEASPNALVCLDVDAEGVWQLIAGTMTRAFAPGR